MANCEHQEKRDINTMESCKQALIPIVDCACHSFYYCVINNGEPVRHCLTDSPPSEGSNHVSVSVDATASFSVISNLWRQWLPQQTAVNRTFRCPTDSVSLEVL